VPLDPEQRARLLAAKLRVLVHGHWPPDPDPAGSARTPAGFGGGAAVVAGDRAWVLLDGGGHGIGSVLAWARQRGIGQLDLLAGEGVDAGVLARRAGYFAAPPTVWAVVGTELAPATAEPWRDPARPPDDLLALADVLDRAGLDVVVDHGVVSGEVLGLEVARVVAGPDATPEIEVGVGRTDREAFAAVHGHLPVDAALRSVVDTVRGHRRAEAPAHPLNRLAGERWLRAHLLADPARLPGWDLRPVEGPIPRGSVNDVVPAILAGTDADGAPVVVACSVGVDLEVVPLAADARTAHDPAARLVIALPARDALEVTRALASALRQPAELLPIEGDWRR
jgi:hypothetical protein